MKYVNIKRLEIDITFLCSLQCFNCDRMISVAPGSADQNITVKQIKKLIAQSVINNYFWEHISLIGGEPTIHPDFREIVGILADYKSSINKSLIISVKTNGYTDKTKDEITWVKENHPEVQVYNSNKVTSIQKHFDNICAAPVDILPEHERHQYEGCWVTEICGIGLNFAGFYCCAVAGAIDRVFGLNLGVKDVAKINSEDMKSMFQVFCSKCGHYCLNDCNDEKDKIIISPSYQQTFRYQSMREERLRNKKIENKISPIWEKAISQYNMRKDNLDRY